MCTSSSIEPNMLLFSKRLREHLRQAKLLSVGHNYATFHENVWTAPHSLKIICTVVATIFFAEGEPFRVPLPFKDLFFYQSHLKISVISFLVHNYVFCSEIHKQPSPCNQVLQISSIYVLWLSQIDHTSSTPLQWYHASIYLLRSSVKKVKYFLVLLEVCFVCLAIGSIFRSVCSAFFSIF